MTVAIAVLSALAVAAVGASIRWGSQLFAALRAWKMPDHLPLFQASWQLTTPSSNGMRTRILACCAPDRAMGLEELDPDAAIAFVGDGFVSRFPDRPEFSVPREGVRFEGPDGIYAGPYCWVWRCGRIDLNGYIDPDFSPDGRIVLPVLELAQHVADLGSAVTSSAYDRVFGHARRPWRRHFDWFIGVSPSLVRTDGVTVYWDDLEFPGRRPLRAGNQSVAFCPPQGFAAKALRSWDPRAGIPSLVAAFLDSFLKENGYHAVDDAIADTVRALIVHSKAPV